MPKFLNISDLRIYSPKDQHYFLDANVWIFALNDLSSADDVQKHYSKIFFKLFEKNNPQSKVLVCSLVPVAYARPILSLKQLLGNENHP